MVGLSSMPRPLTLVPIGELSVSRVQWWAYCPCAHALHSPPSLLPCRANERHAQQLLHPSGLSVPELKPKRVRVVVFRDEKGVKQPIFDSQQITHDEEEVRTLYF